MGRIALFVAGFVALVALVLPAGASAAAWGVSDTTDTPVGQACPGFTGCSLREAVTSTEANPGPDAILVGTGTYPLTNGQLTVTQDLTVARVGAGGATISGSDSSRIFNVTGSGTDFILRFLSLSHGSVSGASVSRGGAIQGGAGTTIGIESSTISDSAVSALNDAQGGAIYSDGNVTIGTASGSTTGSSITGNSAEADPPPAIAHGGGVAVSGGTLAVGARTSITNNDVIDEAGFSPAVGGGVYADAGATFNGATISGNTATGYYANGGGVAIAGGVGSFVRSTISGNSATGSGPTGGGGIHAAGPGSVDLKFSTVDGNSVTTTNGTGVFGYGGGVAAVGSTSSFAATNSTITSNTVSAPAGSTAAGAGIFIQSNTPATVGGVILAENTGSGGSQCDQNAAVGLTSTGYSVLGPLTGCSYTAGPGDVTGVTDAGLAPLGDYGGLTKTVMLELGSPALDIIPTAATLCSDQITDQRGIPRPQPAGGSCDSGSVEARPATLTIIPDPRNFGNVATGSSANANVAISNGGDLAMSAPPSPSVSAPFGYVSGCPSAVGPGSSCIMSLAFAPTTPGDVSDTLTVSSGALSDTATLTGFGWGPNVAPSINGVPSVGFKTKVAQGKWPVKPSGYTFQWLRCDAVGDNCNDISGATRNIYKPKSADQGHVLRAEEVATGPGGVTSNVITTAPSAVVILEVPTVVQPPEVKRSANPVVGTALAAYHGQWTGAPTSYALQWVRCDADGTSNCSDIPGATKKNYTATAADAGHTLRVSVAAGNDVGVSGYVASPPSGVVG